jgi:hypothetical protein
VPRAALYTALPPTGREGNAVRQALRPEQLVHGAYYSRHVHSTPAVARSTQPTALRAVAPELGCAEIKAIPHN